VEEGGGLVGDAALGLNGECKFNIRRW